MKAKQSVAGRWNHWLRTNKHLVKYDLGESYPPAFSLNDVLSFYPEKQEEIQETIMNMSLDYGVFTGPVELRTKIADMYPGATESNILLTHGAVGANDVVLRTLFEPGDNCIVITPNFQQLISLPEALGYECREAKLLPEKNYQVDMDAFQKAIDEKTKIIILSSPNNPLGTLLTEETMSEMIALARSVGAYILVDEIYAQFDVFGQTVPTAYGTYERVLVTSSFSKAYGIPGLRIGWIACNDPELFTEFFNTRHFSTIVMGMLDMYIAQLVIEKFDEIKPVFMQNLPTNLQTLDDFVNNNPHLSYTRPKCSSCTIVTFDYPITSTELCTNIVMETGVQLVPGISFDMDNTFRIGLVAPPEEYKEGLALVEKFLKTL